MYSSEIRRAAVAKTAFSSVAEVAAEVGASPSSLRRWMSRTDLEDRPRSGRPQIQSTADQVVEALVATAGARISGKDYSTRALSEATGLSQSIVSRAVRAMTVPLAQISGAGGAGEAAELTVVAGGFPLSWSVFALLANVQVISLKRRQNRHRREVTPPRFRRDGSSAA